MKRILFVEDEAAFAVAMIEPAGVGRLSGRMGTDGNGRI